MKTGVRIINCARGGIVDEQDLRRRDQGRQSCRRGARRLCRRTARRRSSAGQVGASHHHAASGRVHRRSAAQRRHRGGRADGRFSRQRRGPLRGQRSVGEPGAFGSLAALSHARREARQPAHADGRSAAQGSSGRVSRRGDPVQCRAADPGGAQGALDAGDGIGRQLTSTRR